MKITRNLTVLLGLLALVFATGCASLKDPAVPGPAFVEIRGGPFTMGLPNDEDVDNKNKYVGIAIPHQVTVSDFYLCAYEVTQKEYAEVMGFNPSGVYAPDLPVDYVSWYDAVEFCNRLSKKHSLDPVYEINGTAIKWNRDADGYRLPTEAEWEYACRGGTDTLFYVDIKSKDTEIIKTTLLSHAVFSTGNPFWDQGKVVIGGGYPPNKFGLYDMMGNVYEWCWDWFEKFDDRPQTNPEGPPHGRWRVLRSGCYFTSYSTLRSGNRDISEPNLRWKGNGIRLARNKERL